MKTLESMMKLWDDRHRHMAERLDASGKFDISDESQRHGERLADALAILSLVSDEIDGLKDRLDEVQTWQGNKDQADENDYQSRLDGN